MDTLRCYFSFQQGVQCLKTIINSITAFSLSEMSLPIAQEIRAEYVRHFLSDEFVIGREREARLFKSIIDTITAEDVRQVAEQLQSSASCVVKTVSHRKCASPQPLA